MRLGEASAGPHHRDQIRQAFGVSQIQSHFTGDLEPGAEINAFAGGCRTKPVVQSVTTPRFGGSRFSSGLGTGTSSGRRSGSGSRMSGVHVGASTGGSSVGSGLGGTSILRVSLGRGFGPPQVARRRVWRRKGLFTPHVFLPMASGPGACRRPIRVLRSGSFERNVGIRCLWLFEDCLSTFLISAYGIVLGGQRATARIVPNDLGAAGAAVRTFWLGSYQLCCLAFR